MAEPVSINSLKLDRRNKEAVLTRSLNSLDQLLTSEDTDTADKTIEEILNEAKGQWKELQVAHEKLVTLIVDEEAFQTEENWMSEAQNKFVATRVNTEKYLKKYCYRTLDKEAGDRQLEVAKLDLDRQLHKWIEKRTNTIQRLNSIADEISKVRRNCDIAKTTVTCVALFGEIATLFCDHYEYKLPVESDTIRKGLRVTETVTDNVADFIADYRSSKGAQQANKILQEDDKQTLLGLRVQQRRYCLSLERYMELAKNIDAVVQYRENDNFTEVFLGVGNILKTRIAKLNSNRVKPTIQDCTSFLKALDFNGSPGKKKSLKGTESSKETEPHSDTKQCKVTELPVRPQYLPRILDMVQDVATIFARVNGILNGSPDAAANEIRIIARQLESEIPSTDDLTYESLLTVSSSKKALEF
ncbi:uncharacterized protein LOC117118126 isoform X2 [Anneissia japonica]|uniref:uncharacterized protein LOC117118126 isoform X2 n=1 Tax=Anneissia japonica TaxID=1529436 RepID=UPI001425ACA4|nr:uncharacterized protein LOC117118126 isoform X2 [Anneissia japonica]